MMEKPLFFCLRFSNTYLPDIVEIIFADLSFTGILFFTKFSKSSSDEPSELGVAEIFILRNMSDFFDDLDKNCEIPGDIC